jgi:uncharacterized protein (TIGR02145 family)
MIRILKFILVFCLILATGASCEKEKMILMLNIQGYLEIQSRTNDSGFENGDHVGIFVVDIIDGVSGTLSTTANHANNVKFTYSSTGNIWSPTAGSEIYWNDSKTKVDIYSYYPYNSSVGSTTAYPFSVNADQSIASNYYKSDFLWAKASSITAQTDPVNIYFGHRMSKIVITTMAGAGYSVSEFNAATKSVQILGTKLSSKINLSNGNISVDNNTVNGTISPMANGSVFTAILIPQTIPESTVFFKITVNDVDYYYSKGFTFESNKQYNFSVSVNKNSLSVVTNGISNWTVDGNVYSVKEEAINKDIDGNVYTPIKIGTQTWMKENLKTTKYRNGDPIATTTPATLDISSENAPKYQWAPVGNESNASTYGRLYTWFAAKDNRGICPTGWHVPTEVEWTTLTIFLGGSSVAGGNLKETGTAHWLDPNIGATNSSGFTALPSGYRSTDGTYYNVGPYSRWWSSNETNKPEAFTHDLGSGTIEIATYLYYNKASGCSVRCIRDF